MDPLHHSDRSVLWIMWRSLLIVGGILVVFGAVFEVASFAYGLARHDVVQVATSYTDLKFDDEAKERRVLAGEVAAMNDDLVQVEQQVFELTARQVWFEVYTLQGRDVTRANRAERAFRSAFTEKWACTRGLPCRPLSGAARLAIDGKL